MKKLKLKVCGMKHPDNIAGLTRLDPDFMGFIFYEKSPRYAGELDPEIVRGLPESLKKVGVFVNASEDSILAKAEAYSLDYVQLHGDESPAFAKRLKNKGLKVIKVFRITDVMPPDMDSFTQSADLFLFDTDTKAYGGSGRKFNWKLLRQTEIPRPYLLSGGIGPDDVEDTVKLDLSGMVGIDVNSRFETAPGLKNLDTINEIIPKL